jgi:hypothetical protein
VGRFSYVLIDNDSQNFLLQLYSPFESLAFEWMRLVSAQIQSISYDPLKFLEDIEVFAADVRCVNGIEIDRVETFDDRIQKAMKEVKGGLASNNWDLGQQGIKENLAVVGQKRKGNDKSVVRTKSLSDHATSSGDGVTKLFDSAAEAATKPTINDTKLAHDNSRVASIEDSAERVSRIFQSLHDCGAQLGHIMSAESKRKEKAVDVKGSTRSSSILPSLKKQLPLSRLAVSDIKCRSSSSSSANTILLPSKLSKSKTLHEEIPENSTVSKKLAAPGLIKKAATVDKRNKEIADIASPSKRARLAGHPAVSAPWLKVDVSRASSRMGSSLPDQKVNPTLPSDSLKSNSSARDSEKDQECFAAAEPVTVEDPRTVIASKYIGVHALVKGPNQRTRTGPGPSSSSPVTSPESELDYVARVLLLGRDVNLGMFPTEEAAARY